MELVVISRIILELFIDKNQRRLTISEDDDSSPEGNGGWGTWRT